MNREQALARAIIAANTALAESLSGRAWGPIANRHTDGVVAAFDWATYDATLTALFTVELAKTAERAALTEARRIERGVGVRKTVDGGGINPEAVAAVTAGGVQAVSIAWSLSRTDPWMLQWAQTHAGNLVKSVSASTRKAIRDLVAAAFRGEYTTRDLAKQIRLLVGPLPRDVAAIARAQAANLSMLMESGVPYNMAAERADALARRQAVKAVRRRALTIARTEIIRAESQGKIESWRQADRMGLIEKDARKQWIAYDPCPICESLSGATAPWDGVFPDGYDAPPAHPRCRCTIVMIDPPARK